MSIIATRIAEELSVASGQVIAAIQLLDEGSTVPFISRYRKEVTGGLDDTQLRTLEERLVYLRELEERRGTILKNIEEQGKLTSSLAAAIQAADTKTRLEDLYLPFKQKRRTKGQIALEAGLEPLANALLSNPQLKPEREAAKYINSAEDFKGAFLDSKGVLEGAKYILMERFAEDPELVGELREYLQSEAKLRSSLVKGKELEAAKFRDYFDHADALKNAPSHRILAMLRGRNEGFLNLSIDLDQTEAVLHPCEVLLAKRVGIQNKQRPADAFLAEVLHWTWKVKLHTKLETDLLGDLRQAAETEAIRVFAHNLKDLLLAAPAGQRACLGLDPGLRTGVKVAVIDSTGQFVDHSTIYPHAPRHQWQESIASLAQLARKYQIELIAIGNGTASRETDKLATDLIKLHPELNLQKVVVSEAGASVYSASETAAKEFPDLDVTIRGAVSIARRLQDPLAELVKIEPKSIGVGQYQHDVSQVQLAKNLDAVVEDCVNSVGVEVNTASAALLRRVAGLNQTIADNIVEFRNKNGRFTSRKSLLNVPRLGAKTFEQAAGFLRIQGADNPLDSSAVHPEAYSIVESIAAKTKTNLQNLIGNSPLLKSLNARDFINEKFGLPTITDILLELDKPGRDPRPAFKTATFQEGIETLADLKPALLLEGVVTNVTNFGAFVDIGVHQDGLVHISMLSHQFVKDPHSVVKAGDIVKVKVLEVDLERKRIALSMRLDEPVNNKPIASKSAATKPMNSSTPTVSKPVRSQPAVSPVQNNALAAAFAKAKERQ